MANLKEKGVTVITLVITIIVLLLLSGVTMTMLAGSNSTPQKATDAAQKDAIAGAKDEIAVETQKALIDYYNKYAKENRIEKADTQSDVSKAAYNAVENAKKRNNYLLDTSIVTDNTITLETKSYTLTGTIEQNGGIIWGTLQPK